MNYKKLLNDPKFIIIALFLFSFLIRLLFKNGGLFHFDSYADARTVEQILETGKMQYSYAYGSPTTMILVFLFFIIGHLLAGASQAEAAYFLVTFLTAALSVVLLYLITKKITKNNFISTTAALLLSLSPIFLAVTTYPKTHSISIFFGLLGGYLLLISSEKYSLKYLILSGLSFGLAIGTRPFAALYVLPFALLYFSPKIKNKSIILDKKKFNLKNIITFCISVAIIPILLFLPWWLEQGFSDFLNKINPEVETRGGWLGLFSENTIPSFLNIKDSFTWIGMALAGLGSVYLYLKKKKYLLFVLLFWFAINFFLIGNLARVHARFLIPTFIPLAILIALGLRMIHVKNKMAAIVILLILLGSMFSIAYPIINYRHNYSGTKEFALFVQENTPANSVIMSNDLGFFIEYYGDRTKIAHPRNGNDEAIAEFIQELKDYLASGTEVYATEEGFGIDPEQKVLAAIQENFEIEFIGEKESEWYGGSSMELKPYNEKLFKLVLKNQ